MKFVKRSKFFATVGCIFGVLAMQCPAHAESYSPTGARVTQIASNQLYGQNAVIFKLDKGTADCAAGSYIYYYGTSTDDLKAMYASIVTSYVAATPVIVHYKNGCVIDAIGMGT